VATTFQPSAAKRCTLERPNPDAVPVITRVFPMTALLDVRIMPIYVVLVQHEEGREGKVLPTT
jgi:hypothetical protein